MRKRARERPKERGARKKLTEGEVRERPGKVECRRGLPGGSGEKPRHLAPGDGVCERRRERENGWGERGDAGGTWPRETGYARER